MKTLGLAVCLLATAASAAPRLAVVIVVDQLSTEMLERRARNAKGGFALLEREGFRARSSLIPYAPPVTAAGHASITTGATPDIHGIVGNAFYDRAEERRVVAGEDRKYARVGKAPQAAEGTAPTQLNVPTIGDALKLQHAEATVVSIAGKARSALMLGGSAADVALWIDTDAPRFTTSTFYAADVPGWLAPFNAALERVRPGIGPFRFELPRGGFTGKDGPALATSDAEAARVFAESPAADEAVLEAGLLAIESLAMGKDVTPDLLLLGLSAHDHRLHQTGPVAPEAARAFAAIDGALARFIARLDATIGRRNYSLVLTADHGGPRHPQDALARRIPSGRIDVDALQRILEGVADAALGPGDYFTPFHGSGFSVKAPARARIHTIDNELREAARRVEGVVDLVPEAEVRAGASGTLGALYAKSFDPRRSPDFTVIPRAHFMFGTEDATTHASPYLYDRAVPLLLFGVGVRRGVTDRASPLDVAPTLAHLLEISPPAGALEGRILEEGLVGRREQ